MITKIEMEYMEAVKRIAREMSKPKEIDWEARRYEIAKDILVAHVNSTWVFGDDARVQQVKDAVKYADMLIEELEKTKG